MRHADLATMFFANLTFVATITSLFQKKKYQGKNTGIAQDRTPQGSPVRHAELATPSARAPADAGAVGSRGGKGKGGGLLSEDDYKAELAKQVRQKEVAMKRDMCRAETISLVTSKDDLQAEQARQVRQGEVAMKRDMYRAKHVFLVTSKEDHKAGLTEQDTEN